MFEEKNSVVVLCQDMILGMTPFYCRYPDLNLKKHPIARLAGCLESRVRPKFDFDLIRISYVY